MGSRVASILLLRYSRMREKPSWNVFLAKSLQCSVWPGISGLIAVGVDLDEIPGRDSGHSLPCALHEHVAAFPVKTENAVGHVVNECAQLSFRRAQCGIGCGALLPILRITTTIP